MSPSFNGEINSLRLNTLNSRAPFPPDYANNQSPKPEIVIGGGPVQQEWRKQKIELCLIHAFRSHLDRDENITHANQTVGTKKMIQNMRFKHQSLFQKCP